MNWNSMGIFGWVMMILFWTFLVVMIIWAIRSLGSMPSRPTALDLLEQRFAAGEIDSQEFEQRKRLLADR